MAGRLAAESETRSIRGGPGGSPPRSSDPDDGGAHSARPPGEDRVIAGEVEGRAVGQLLQGELEERSIRYRRGIPEHPPRRILPEPETQPGIEDQFAGVQGGEIAGIAVRASRQPLEEPVNAPTA